MMETECIDLPIVKGISEDWTLACRTAAYRFYLAAAERRFANLAEIVKDVTDDWGDINGNWTRATLPFAFLSSLGLEERLVEVCEGFGIHTIGDLDRQETDDIFLALPNVGEIMVGKLREFSRAAWAAVDEART
jgi:hypothetical protein